MLAMHPVRPPKKAFGATLDGYDGPFFPDPIEKLQEIFDTSTLTREWLVTAANLVQGFTLVHSWPNLITNGEHTWDIGFMYRLRDEVYAVLLFPKKDAAGHGVWSCAAYLRGASNAVDGNRELVGLIQAFTDSLQR